VDLTVPVVTVEEGKGALDARLARIKPVRIAKKTRAAVTW
jgi:hypothetical protein